MAKKNRNVFGYTSPGEDTARQLATGDIPRGVLTNPSRDQRIVIDNETPNVDPIKSAEQAAIDYDAKRKNFRQLEVSKFAGKVKRQKAYSVYPVVFTNAGTDVEVNIQGNVIFFADSTNGSDRVFVKFDSKNADPVPLKAGMAFNNWSFERVYLTWSAVAGATGYLFIGNDTEETLRIT